MKVTQLKEKSYIVQCFANGLWWDSSSFTDKNTAIDLFKNNRRVKKEAKWRAIERVTITKVKQIS